MQEKLPVIQPYEATILFSDNMPKQEHHAVCLLLSFSEVAAVIHAKKSDVESFHSKVLPNHLLMTFGCVASFYLKHTLMRALLFFPQL